MTIRQCADMAGNVKHCLRTPTFTPFHPLSESFFCKVKQQTVTGLKELPELGIPFRDFGSKLLGQWNFLL